MFYDVRKNDHGLPHDPFKAIVAPRPIGWITSMSAAGEINLAPYSWFNGVSSRPPMVMFSSETRKDSLAFIEETREFVCNFTTFELREQVNQTSAPLARGVNEMASAGLEPAPSRLVRPPRVAASPCALECLWVKTVSLDDCEGRPTDRHVVFGQVIGIYIDERFIKDGLLDTGAMRPIQRAGYHDYYTVMPETRFAMRRPPGGEAADRDARLTVIRERIGVARSCHANPAWRAREREKLQTVRPRSCSNSGDFRGTRWTSGDGNTAATTPMIPPRVRARRSVLRSDWYWAAAPRAALPISASCARSPPMASGRT